jgi:nicotinamide-nucleotide amidase
MHAETIAIGTELTTGAKLDTNSQWLSIELSALGIPVQYHTTVADDLAANIAVFRAAVDRADIVLITGGLGPTLDDLTREAMAAMAGVPLLLDAACLEQIQAMFTRRGREMPERNKIQAMFPTGAEIVPNARGTAPGIAMSIARAGRNDAWIVALPGVPSEMKPMFTGWVRPRLLAMGAGSRVIRGKRIQCFGLGESACEEMLGDVTARGRDPEVGITVHLATITLRIVAEGTTASECDAKIAATETIIRQRLGNYVFGEEDEELQHVVLRQLARSGQTLATAEAGTGGLLASCLTAESSEAPGYVGGVVLGNSTVRELLLPTGAVVSGTEEIARRMAESIRERLGTTWGLAVTEVASETPDGPPVAYVAVASEHSSRATMLNLLGDPSIGRARLAKTGLNLLRLELIHGRG